MYQEVEAQDSQRQLEEASQHGHLQKMYNGRNTVSPKGGSACRFGASITFCHHGQPAFLHQTRSSYHSQQTRRPMHNSSSSSWLANLDGEVVELCLSRLLQRALGVVVVRDGLEVWYAALKAICNN